MNILIVASLGVAVAFLGCFIWAVRNGQYEDTLTPSMRVLTDDDGKKPGGHDRSVSSPANKQSVEKLKAP
ncbi:MAG: cbb3-type cytochrome oxidase assembly protein CcoS [Limisphaerales bacterium]